MTINNKLFVLFLVFLFACKPDESNNQQIIPNVPVNVLINTDLPLYQHLKQLGSHHYIEEGYKGIVLIHNFDGQYYALERACTFHPFDTCGVVEVDEKNLNLRCGSEQNNQFKSCCTSTFQYDGFVGNGPSRIPLKRYHVQQNGASFHILN